MSYIFDAAAVREDLIKWIREWFEINGKDAKAVLGLSGGKDSTIAASLCKAALGADRVFGVLMPNGVQPDIEDSYELVESLGIPYAEINISDSYLGIEKQLGKAGITMTKQAQTNLPPRLRMSSLYAVSQSIGGRVANTCNLSETYVGWETRWGDQVGDFSPLGGLTVTEVIAIGRLCDDIPERLVVKAPSDGLTGRTDEDNLGTRYAYIDAVIRGCAEDVPQADLDRIAALTAGSEFKRQSISLPTFIPKL
ncbi:NAD(+) synthase [Butyrivibrio sp. MC2013]|uniref:NAD(+) synthase n=1 Tax=Butyrivibrio sp. MC2013 TaxID=1280686 RepID=UPI0003F988B4|nr:NAD(+) synthase [Butyrivibrio sp. MC2013]